MSFTCLTSNIDVFLCDVYKKNIENFLWLSFCDMTVPSENNVLVTLTFDLSMSYQNMGIGFLHVKRRTRQK